MGDHFVLLVDRLLTESTLEAVIASKNCVQEALPLVNEAMTTEFSSHGMAVDVRSSPKQLVECRICHDEDDVACMETPCSCSGTLKFAHRKCIQRWCNEKGDTICEICLQKFKPGYTAPLPLFHYGSIPMNFRGTWEISRRDMHNPGFIAMVGRDREWLNPNVDDFAVTTTRSLICCRIVATIFVTLLVLRHILPVILGGAGEYSFAYLTISILRIIAILLPIYVLVKAFTAYQRRHHNQDHRNYSNVTSDEENNLAGLPRLPRLIHVQ